MTTPIDVQAERFGLAETDFQPSEALAIIRHLIEAGKTNPDDPSVLVTLEGALRNRDLGQENHILAAITELTMEDDTPVSDAAFEKLLAISAEGKGRLSALATFELSKVVRSGSEAKSRQVLEHLKPIVADSDQPQWVDAVQALACGRSSRFSSIAHESVDSIEKVLHELEGSEAKDAYLAVCFQASEPNPEVADRVDQIKEKYRDTIKFVGQ